MGKLRWVACGLGAAFLCAPWMAAAHDSLPLVFEANQGQSDRQVRFLARADGFTLFLTPSEIVASGPQGHVRLRLRGSAPAAVLEGLEPLPGKSNYFTGRDRAIRGIPQFARTRYRGVYPGIDLVFYGDRRRVEFDFELAPGADPSRVRLEFDGATPHLAPDGSVSAAALHLARPIAFQGGGRIPAAFVLEDSGGVAFRLASYDRARPLRIDPLLSYSTYLGGDTAASGGNDYIRGVATDAAGNVYLAGTTESPSFPAVAAQTPRYRGGPSNAVLVKLASDGTPIYSTYFGGDDLFAEAWAIAADASGNTYVTGHAYIGRFPATPGAYQSVQAGARDVFVLKLDSSGQPVYATLLGGEGDDYGTAIAVDASGSAVVAGATASARFPMTEGALQTSKTGFSVPFIARFSPDGAKLLYSTYLGEQGDLINAIAFDAAGTCLVAGQAATDRIPVTGDALRGRRQSQDGFLLKLDGSGSAVVYSTLIGGSGIDSIRAMQIDGAGNIWLAGSTTSTDLPVSKNAAQPKYGGGSDAFLMKLDPAGKEILHLTYYGGKGLDVATALAVDGAGFILVAGESASPDLPGAASGVQPVYGGGPSDGFLAIFDPDVQPVSATYLGGTGEERLTGMALDPTGDPWLAGYTLSPDFPVTPGAWRTALSTGGSDGFLTRLGGFGTFRVYSTYVGGGGGSRGEQATDVAVDSSGAALVAGTSYSTNFPTTQGSFRAAPAGFTDAFVTKLAGDGGTLLFSTYLGGAADDSAAAIALAPDGSILVAGSTSSQDFPVTDGAAQAKLAGGVDAWIARLSQDGSQLLYSTYLGGSGQDNGVALAVHASGDFFLVANSNSGNFPLTPDSFQTPIASADVRAARFSAEGKLLWAARAGGSSPDQAYSAAVDASGRLLIGGITDSRDFPTTPGALQTAPAGGRDGFLLQLDPEGRSPVFSTYLGGSGSDELRRVALAPDGDLFAAGFTISANFPTTPGVLRPALIGSSDDGFISRLRPDGSALVWSTFLGANGSDRIYAMALDAASNVVVAGATSSASFPVTPQIAFQTVNRGGSEGFVSKLSSDGRTLAYSSLIGGGQNDVVNAVAVDAAGNPVIVGQTCSPDFPVTAAAIQPAAAGACNGFAARFELTAAAQPRNPPRIDAIQHYVLGTSNLNPGQIIKVTGANLATATVVAAKPTEKPSAPLPVTLGGTRLTMSPNTPVPLFSVSPTEIVAQLPFDAGSATLRVSTFDGEASRQVTVIYDPQWGLLAGYRADGTLVTEQNRLKLGEPVTVHLTGGVLPPGGRPPAGEPVPPAPVYDQFIPLPRVFVIAVPPAGDTGLDCQLLSLRMVPGYVGVAEARVSIPSNTATSSGVWDLYMAVGNGSSNKLRLFHENR